MAHSLTIKDNADDLLYDLLKIVDTGGISGYQTAVIIDLKSRQIIPLENDRWEERYTIFGKTATSASLIATAVLEIDKIAKVINDDLQTESFDNQTWLHEQSEGESTARRRAPLFGASQQPIVNGAVGQLQINNAYIGLLSLTRGDWEDVTERTVTFSTTPSLIFDKVSIDQLGSKNGRVSNISLATDDMATDILAIGERADGYGTTNFQPCVNFGVATGISGVTRTTNSFATYPTGQPAPTGNAISYSLWIGTLSDVLKVQLNQVSLSALDSVNKDYVGTYTAFFRYGIRQISGTPTYYIKFSPFYGYEGDFIDLDPVYIPAGTAARVGTDYFHGVQIGEIKIPNDRFYYVTGTDTTLSEFTFGMGIDLVGTQDGSIEIFVDSIILVPSNNIILSDTVAATWATPIDSYIRVAPDGSTFMTSTSERVIGQVITGMKTTNISGIAVLYHEKWDTAAGTPSRTVSLSYYPRYNSLSEPNPV